MKIILASKSTNRQQVLKIAHIPFKSLPANIDESVYDHPDPKIRAKNIARAKARFIAQKQKSGLIIGADTFSLYRGKVLEKPTFKMDALDTLKLLSGKSHYSYTGWTVINSHNHKEYAGVSQTKVTLRQVSHKELLNYVNDNPVVNWAAGYSPLNTTAITFIKKIEGSVTGFSHGLPLEQIFPVLQKEKAI